MSNRTLFTLPPSPNNIKVRLALQLKGLEYTPHPVDFEHREEVVAASGQPLTPVLVDGDRVIYDSHGILRYLDANYPGPALFRADRDEQRAIQDWETFAKGIGSALSLVLRQALSGEIDEAATAEAQGMLDGLLPQLERALADGDFLMGDAPNAADLSVAPFLKYVVEDPAAMAEGPGRFIAERMHLSADFPRTRAWVERVLQLDPVPAH